MRLADDEGVLGTMWASIAQLYAVEKKIRGKPPATRQAVRWTESAPLVNRFGVWLDEQRSRVSGVPGPNDHRII